MKALVITACGFEEAELLVPYYRLLEEGAEVDIAAPRAGMLRGKHGYEVRATKAFADVDPDDYGLLVIPGGDAPATLVRDDRALQIARSFSERRLPIAAICHGPLVLLRAGVLADRRATGHPSIAPQMLAARVRYADREVIVDDNLVTSRRPSDLPAFMRELMVAARHERRGASR